MPSVLKSLVAAVIFSMLAGIASIKAAQTGDGQGYTEQALPRRRFMKKQNSGESMVTSDAPMTTGAALGYVVNRNC